MRSRRILAELRQRDLSMCKAETRGRRSARVLVGCTLDDLEIVELEVADAQRSPNLINKLNDHPTLSSASGIADDSGAASWVVADVAP